MRPSANHSNEPLPCSYLNPNRIDQPDLVLDLKLRRVEMPGAALEQAAPAAAVEQASEDSVQSGIPVASGGGGATSGEARE